nr:immunoglobulin light chain junction region [Macaca mulatta]MOX18567.1 immunoglobulin light chain junction region [Macaca mulatta]MOX20981.1 immunoglobulin light chain junction region [Macaca mulatta]MOX22043.1 immunoglobulin light chain junction region [Macaca mulatta]MOX23312.1 immunoglobulin light chain junction region [Macaca mulatta]
DYYCATWDDSLSGFYIF